jgi:hypothetical protein
MKLNNDEIYALKKKHKLELVMQETGEAFEVDPQNPERWLSTVTPGLTVDLRRQLFEIKLSDKTEAGDVLAWLRRRYSWTFGMALRFLQRRQPDPKTDAPSKPEKQSTGADMHPPEISSAALDRWQLKALELAGERIRPYFAFGLTELVLYVEEVRIEPVIAPQVTHCQRCDKLIDWPQEAKKSLVEIPVLHGRQLKYIGPLPQVAYAIKRHPEISHLDFHNDEALDDLAYEVAGVFVEDGESIVCQDCAWVEFRFEAALGLCKRSALSRER